MDKIGAYTGTADSNDEFTEGNPSTGTPATEVDGGWLNAVQREMVQVIESMGLTLDTADDTLLWQAFQAVYGKTFSGDPNGNVAANVVRERCWDISTSPWTLYIATDANGTVGGTTWETLASVLNALTESDLAENGGDVVTEDHNNVFSVRQDINPPVQTGLSVSRADDQVLISVQRTGAGASGGHVGAKGSDFVFEATTGDIGFRVPGIFNNVGEVTEDDGGLVWGSPAGGARGFGTTNAEEQYENGQRIGPIETATVELGGDFNAGEEVYCRRDGERVTIMSIGSLAHSDTTAPSSSSGAIPSAFRPSDSALTVYSSTSSSIGRVQVQSDGTFSIIDRNWDGNTISSGTNAGVVVITYLIT